MAAPANGERGEKEKDIPIAGNKLPSGLQTAGPAFVTVGAFGKPSRLQISVVQRNPKGKV